MSSVFARFDKEFDLNGLKEDLKNVGTGDGHYREVPYGTYEVKIEKLELVESKTGKPMVTSWMRIVGIFFIRITRFWVGSFYG